MKMNFRMNHFFFYTALLGNLLLAGCQGETTTVASVLTPSPSSTPPPMSTPTLVPVWISQIGGVPVSGNTYSQSLKAGELLMLTGGELELNKNYCGGELQQICVVLYRATYPHSVSIGRLVPENNYVGISQTHSFAEALDEKTLQFWQSPNCGNGCRKATILSFQDGKMISRTERFVS